MLSKKFAKRLLYISDHLFLFIIFRPPSRIYSLSKIRTKAPKDKFTHPCQEIWVLVRKRGWQSESQVVTLKVWLLVRKAFW